jgi:sugar phosphate isomerase/epimerase
MDALRRVIAIAREVGTSLVRIMCFRKESVLFGSHGAESAVVTKGAWDKFVQLMEPPVRYAEAEGIQLVVENSTKGMVTSAYLARKLIDALGTPTLKALWDPSNALYFHETPFPTATNACAAATSATCTSRTRSRTSRRRGSTSPRSGTARWRRTSRRSPRA